MKEITVAKASPIGDQVIESVTISIVGEVPDFGNDQEFVARAKAFYGAEAEAIVEALEGSLPGGVLDRLLAKLMERKASLWRVAW